MIENYFIHFKKNLDYLYNAYKNSKLVPYNIVLKGIKQNETVYSESGFDYIEKYNNTFYFNNYKTIGYKKINFYGKWLLKSSQDNSTSYINITTTFKTDYQYNVFNEYYINVSNYTPIMLNFSHIKSVNTPLEYITIKFELRWVNWNSGNSTGEIWNPPPSGNIPPPIIPGSSGSTAYCKFLFYFINLEV